MLLAASLQLLLLCAPAVAQGAPGYWNLADGVGPGAEQLWQETGRRRSPEDLGRLLARLQAGPLGRSLAPFGPEAIDRILSELPPPGRESEKRKRLLDGLRLAGGAENKSVLLEVLRSTDTEVAQAALDALTDDELWAPADLPRVAWMLADPCPAVRKAGLMALSFGGELWDERLCPLLIELLAGASDPLDRAAAAGHLGMRQVAAARGALLKAKSDPSAEVRQAAQLALQELDRR